MAGNFPFAAVTCNLASSTSLGPTGKLDDYDDGDGDDVDVTRLMW